MRLSKDEYFLALAHTTAIMSTCQRRQVGAVAIDKDKYIIATGYNGVPKGAIHCTTHPCGGHVHESGDELDSCEAIHAEANLIAHCQNPKEIDTIYLTTTPCMSCMKLIVATNCRRIVASEIYDKDAIDYFEHNGGELILIEK